MPKTKKDAVPARKPVKARGSLPTPVVAPKRGHVVWYKRRNVQAAIAFAVVFLGIFLFVVIKDLRAGSRDKRLDVRSIEQFERKLQLLNAPLQGVYQAIQTSPDQFVAGTLPADDYRKQAQGWVDEFRKLYTGIKEAPVREGVEGLSASKASFAQGAVVLVDAAKALLTAGSVEPAERQNAVNLGRSMLAHGGAIVSMGEREIGQVKNDYGLNDPPVDLPAPVVPEEVTQVAVTPTDPNATVTPQVVPNPAAVSPAPQAPASAPSPAASSAP